MRIILFFILAMVGELAFARMNLDSRYARCLDGLKKVTDNEFVRKSLKDRVLLDSKKGQIAFLDDTGIKIYSETGITTVNGTVCETTSRERMEDGMKKLLVSVLRKDEKSNKNSPIPAALRNQLHDVLQECSTVSSVAADVLKEIDSAPPAAASAPTSVPMPKPRPLNAPAPQSDFITTIKKVFSGSK